MPTMQTVPTHANRIRADITELHRQVDDLTAEMQNLESEHRADIVRRAEEAGAALARLEWALDRAIDE